LLLITLLSSGVWNVWKFWDPGWLFFSSICLLKSFYITVVPLGYVVLVSFFLALRFLCKNVVWSKNSEEPNLIK
jgi:hypothetical protein